MTDLHGIPTLTTARLMLRGPQDSDSGPLGVFLASPRASWIGGPYHASDAARWVVQDRRKWAETGRGSWIVALRADDRPIGRVGLLDHEGWHEPELAWFLFAGFEGHGYAHEAALAARAFAADVLKLPPLFSFIEPGNLRSKALAERLGAVPESAVDFHDLCPIVYRHPAGEAAA